MTGGQQLFAEYRDCPSCKKEKGMEIVSKSTNEKSWVCVCGHRTVSCRPGSITIPTDQKLSEEGKALLKDAGIKLPKEAK